MPNQTRRIVLSSLLVLSASATTPAFAGPAPEDGARRIMVFGDSQAQGLAAGFQRLYRADRERRIVDRSKIATGLNRLTYDWPAQAHTIAAERPDVAIALFGANDRPAIRIAGRIEPGLLQRFTDTYGGRVAEIAACFAALEIPLVWVGHPIVRDPAYAEDMALLNDIFADRAGAQGATFASTWDAFKGADGAYSAYGRGADGQTTRLRADDGVHMTPAGYDLITSMLLPEIERARRPDRRQAPLAARPPLKG